MTLGGYNLSYGQEGGDTENATISWNRLVDSNYWSVNIYGAKVGNYDIRVSSKTAIVDTGTSYLLLPS